MSNAFAAGRLGRFTGARGLLLAGLLLASPGASAEPRDYQIDPEHLSIAFLAGHIGYARVLGMFREASGSFRFDEDSGVVSDMRIVVQSKSLFTNHKKRDEHLRGPDFFNVAEFPEVTFTAPSARAAAAGRFEIQGKLTLLGITRPLNLEATLNKAAKYPIGGLFSKPYVVGVSARARVERGAFGMSYAIDNGWVSNEVDLMIEFEARRK